MATHPPRTKCTIYGRPNEYRVSNERPDNLPPVFGPTDWVFVPHSHTQDEINAWRKRIEEELEMTT